LRQQRESLIIKKIKEKLKERSLPDYLGDDAAVVKNNFSQQILLSQDSLIEGVHFSLETITPEELGWKALAVNVSDLVAMAGIPRFALLSLSFPRNLTQNWLDRFIDGFLDCVQEYQIYLVGGDLTRADRFFISVSVLGEENQIQKITLRSNSLENQAVYVTGQFGYAAAGLSLVKKFKRNFEISSELIEKHFRPKIRFKEALELVDLSKNLQSAPSMIDSSDGLLDSLERISQQSKVNLKVSLDSLVDQNLIKASKGNFDQILSWILVGGEDYELVATAEDNLDFNKDSTWKKIGKVSSKSSKPELLVEYKRKTLSLEKFKKFDHFNF